MVNESTRLAGVLIAKGERSRPSPLLAHLRSAGGPGASENYGKNRSIRIDTVTEPVAAGPLTLSANMLKNKLALSAARVGAALEWAAPRGLCGLIRVGA